ncbi:hypothetical protein BRC95_00265 [Halobacteriales archaeon QS_5_68_33]|nr:MAG: hypothetical protein BRC95_00265 [Halobacteriales archaeon QS_5_68_33]
MADDHDDGHGHGHGEDRPAYDPSSKDLPERAPPLRSTAPQSDYAMRDVGVGCVVLAVGLALTFGLALALV